MYAAIYNPASSSNDREPVILPFGGHAAAHTNLASRGLPYDGAGALATSRGPPLATIPEASSSDSDDPWAEDSSDSFGYTEVRYDRAI